MSAVYEKSPIKTRTIAPSKQGLGAVERFTLACGHYRIFIWSKGVSAYPEKLVALACYDCAQKKGAAA